MKKLIVVLFSTMYFGVINAQNTLLVYTKFPSQLSFIDVQNNDIPKKAIWSEEEGGYVINFDETGSTFVHSSSDGAIFKLSDQSKVTKLIAMPADDKISLEKCFSDQKYCCDKLTDKQRKSTEKIYAVAVMKKDANMVEYFAYTNTTTQFSSAEEVNLKWYTDKEISKVYIVDLESLETVFESSDVSKEGLSLEGKGLKLKESNYQIAVEFKEIQYKKQTLNFEINGVAFQNDEYYLPSQKKGIISWKTQEKISSLVVLNTETMEELAHVDNPEASFFEVASISKNLKSEEQYTIKLTTENGDEYSKNFEILFDNSAVEELAQIVE